MLGINTIDFYSKKLHENRFEFPEERNAFVFDHQLGRRDVTRKPAIRLIRRPLDFLKKLFFRKEYVRDFLGSFKIKFIEDGWRTKHLRAPTLDRVRPFKFSPGRGGEPLRDFTFTSAVLQSKKLLFS